MARFNGPMRSFDFILKEGDFYYIYYYSRTCPQCDYLKERINNFIANSDNNVYTLSLENIFSGEFNMFKEVDSLKTNEEMKNEMINAIKINDVYLIGYLSLYLIDTNYQNNEKYLKDVILGNRKINEYLDSINF